MRELGLYRDKKAPNLSVGVNSWTFKTTQEKFSTETSVEKRVTNIPDKAANYV